MSSPSVITVVAALIVRDGRLLICQRRHDDAFPLQWEFPGGKVQPNETPGQALQRELQEELGVTSEIGEEIHRTRYHYPQMAAGIELIFFRASLTTDTDPQNLAFERMDWAAPVELLAYDFLPADRELISLLTRGVIPL